TTRTRACSSCWSWSRRNLCRSGARAATVGAAMAASLSQVAAPAPLLQPRGIHAHHHAAVAFAVAHAGAAQGAVQVGVRAAPVVHRAPQPEHAEEAVVAHDLGGAQPDRGAV